jgi:hypothetical protein
VSDIRIYRHLTSDYGILVALMPESNLSEAILRLQSEVAALSRRQQAAFFVSCAEGLFPLYASANTPDGNKELLRRVANIAWSFVQGGVPLSDSKALLAALEMAIPDERVEAPQSTFAQDVVICLDAAIRAATTNEAVNPAWVEYALEPITMAVCQEETGFYDLGNSDSADRWEQNALNNPRLSKAMNCCTKMLDYIKRRQVFAAVDAQSLVEMSGNLACLPQLL